MCGIFCSLNVNTFNKLAKLNGYRGNFNHSVSRLNLSSMEIVEVKQLYSPFVDVKQEDFGVSDYLIGHTQAPTGQYDDNPCIHPASIGNSFLWHNGILKESEINRLQSKHEKQTNWDTYLLLCELLLDFKNLSHIDGSFACLFAHKGKFYIFRNMLVPIYHDTIFNISSTKFEDSVLLKPNTLFELNFGDNVLIPICKFETKDNPYII